MTSLPASGPSLKQRIKESPPVRAFRRNGRGFEHWLGGLSPVGNGEIIDRAWFPWVARLEENWPTIRRELEGVLADRRQVPDIQDLSVTQRELARSAGDWKSFFLHAYGYWPQENCRRCPETTRLLAGIPGLTLAFFSILAPGTHIPRHRGAYKGLVRAHLGLIVPEPSVKVRMQVGSAVVHWKEGECVLFDDTYKHEVWNETEGMRVVLLLDVPRPWPPILAFLNRIVLWLGPMTPQGADFLKRVRLSERGGADS